MLRHRKLFITCTTPSYKSPLWNSECRPDVVTTCWLSGAFAHVRRLLQMRVYVTVFGKDKQKYYFAKKAV